MDNYGVFKDPYQSPDRGVEVGSIWNIDGLKVDPGLITGCINSLDCPGVKAVLSTGGSETPVLHSA